MASTLHSLHKNKGNKLANEKTELKFEIERLVTSEFRLLAVTTGDGSNQNIIELARRDRRGNWDRSGFTDLKKLETHCSKILNELEQEKSRFRHQEKDLQVKYIINFCDELQKHFNDLLIT